MLIESVKKEKKTTKKVQDSSLIMTKEEYTNHLETRLKIGLVKMVGKWCGFYKPTIHQCQYEDCRREWKPTPKRMASDIGYCPSCVKSWSNLEDRFKDKPWVADIPNTLYFYKLKVGGKVFHKIGRTEEFDSDERFSLKERKSYNMEKLGSLRMRLEDAIKMENKFKKIANLVSFPEANFHGKNETFIDENPRRIWEEIQRI
jgi:hypothetical protein